MLMNHTITQESFDNLTSYWADPKYRLKWNSVFTLPPWLKVWWQEFKPEGELCLSVVRQGEEIIGLAPLLVREGKGAIIGSADVCD